MCLWFCILCKVMLFTQVFSRLRKGMCVLEGVRGEITEHPEKRQLTNSSVIPSAFCEQCIIFCVQVLPTSECHPGGAQCHHRDTVQPHVWEDRGGESGEHQPGTVQYSGMCGYSGGRAGLHTLFHQRWVGITYRHAHVNKAGCRPHTVK